MLSCVTLTFGRARHTSSSCVREGAREEIVPLLTKRAFRKQAVTRNRVRRPVRHPSCVQPLYNTARPRTRHHRRGVAVIKSVLGGGRKNAQRLETHTNIQKGRERPKHFRRTVVGVARPATEPRPLNSLARDKRQTCAWLKHQKTLPTRCRDLVWCVVQQQATGLERSTGSRLQPHFARAREQHTRFNSARRREEAPGRSSPPSAH